MISQNDDDINKNDKRAEKHVKEACMRVFSIHKSRRGLAASEIERFLTDTLRPPVLPFTRQRAARVQHALESLVARGYLYENKKGGILWYKTTNRPWQHRHQNQQPQEQRQQLQQQQNPLTCIPRITPNFFDPSLLGSTFAPHENREPLALSSVYTKTEWLQAILPADAAETVLSAIPQSIRTRYMDVDYIHIDCEQLQTLAGIARLPWLEQFQHIGVSLCKALYDAHHPDKFPFPQQRLNTKCINPFSDIILHGPNPHRCYWCEESRYFVAQILPGRLYLGPLPVALKTEDISYEVASVIRAAMKSYGVTSQVSFLEHNNTNARVPGLAFSVACLPDIYYYNMTEEKTQAIVSAVHVIDKSMRDGNTTYVHSGDSVYRPCIAVMAYLLGIGNPETNPQPLPFVDAYRLLLRERGGCYGYGMNVGLALYPLYTLSKQYQRVSSSTLSDLWIKIMLTTSNSTRCNYKTMLFECVEQMRLSADEEFREWLGEFGSPEYQFFANVLLEAFKTFRDKNKTREDWKVVFEKAAADPSFQQQYKPFVPSEANLLLLNELSMHW